MRAWQNNLRRGMIWTERFNGRWCLWDTCPKKIGTALSSLSLKGDERRCKGRIAGNGVTLITEYNLLVERATKVIDDELALAAEQIGTRNKPNPTSRQHSIHSKLSQPRGSPQDNDLI